jgi:HD superfamily phosphodiesterase
MNWDLFIRELYKRAKPYLENRNDFVHTQVAHQYARVLLKQERGDSKIVEPAVILHDVGWSEVRPDELKIAFGVRAKGAESKRLNRIHEKEGARIAGQILKDLGYDDLLIERIARIIERHDSGKNPDSIEEKTVKDADKLWRYSKIGFAHEIERQALTHEARYDALSKNIEKWFFTNTAKRIAAAEVKERFKECSKN